MNIEHYKDFIENNIDLIDEFNYSSLFRELHYYTLREQNEVIGILRQIDFFNRFHIECNYSLNQLNSDYIQLLKNYVNEISYSDIILIAGTERTDLYIDHMGFKEYRPLYTIVILPKIDYKYTYKLIGAAESPWKIELKFEKPSVSYDLPVIKGHLIDIDGNIITNFLPQLEQQYKEIKDKWKILIDFLDNYENLQLQYNNLASKLEKEINNPELHLTAKYDDSRGSFMIASNAYNKQGNIFLLISPSTTSKELGIFKGRLKNKNVEFV